jgi:hypothetical protein
MTDIIIQKHYVTFYSPGTFLAETSVEPIDTWSVEEALAKSRSIKERYGATPYGFRFNTRGRSEADLDSKELAKSPMYYIGGKVETLEEIEARNEPREEILRSNMRSNGYDRVWRTTEGWQWTQPLGKDDVVLDA